jgi:predicted DsbA family dithiol-disulfide isomerase
MAVQLEVTYDLVCPFCFVGVSRLQRAVSEATPGSADVHLWPYQLQPDVPAGGVDQRSFFATRFGEDRVAAIYSKMQAMAAAEGLRIDYERMKILPNTRRAHQAVQSVETGPERLQLAIALMRAHFSDGRNIGDSETLREIAAPYIEPTSLDAYWSSAAASQRTLDARERATKLGIRSVPNFILDGKAIATTPTLEELEAMINSGRR